MFAFYNRIPLSFFCNPFGREFRMFTHIYNDIPTIFHTEKFISWNNDAIAEIDANLYTTSESMCRYSSDVRRCYFEGERKLQFFKSYSKAFCSLECIANHALKNVDALGFQWQEHK
ncbi:hypothetical protein PVAND_007278 [Polypedilum vanderplanki]|uniref:Uncharacterized protein n=1 Tax=Polypedilum vanderplanki TaxID=319348 RepID=A0A9J6C6S6_POLVA|nr:hypothetical protein PVAND_007278 [Polypedilum vanderplanki]